MFKFQIHAYTRRNKIKIKGDITNNVILLNYIHVYHQKKKKMASIYRAHSIIVHGMHIKKNTTLSEQLLNPIEKS